MAMRRRRRQQPGEDDAAELAAEGELLADGEHEEGEGEQLALEDGEEREFQGPVGRPTSLGPSTTPLFSPEQLRDLREVQSQAPHLYAKVPRESVWRPGGELHDPRGPTQQQSTTTGTPSPLPGPGHGSGEPRRGVHRINNSLKSKSRRRAMEIELRYQINLLFKYEVMDQDIEIAWHSRDMERVNHQGM